jgi:hypothetical protein
MIHCLKNDENSTNIVWFEGGNLSLQYIQFKRQDETLIQMTLLYYK